MHLKTLIPALLLFATLAASAPASASGCEDVPAVRVCYGEWTEGEACSQTESVDWGYTYARVEGHQNLFRASFEGSYSCWRFPVDEEREERFRGEDIRTNVAVAGHRAELEWVSHEWTDGEESETACDSALLVTPAGGQKTRVALGCPGGAPPQMDWGRILA